MFGDIMRAIIDLLKLRKDEKKVDLEIDKLQREKKKEASVIQLATPDEIPRYDPQTRRNLDAARAASRAFLYSPGGNYSVGLKIQHELRREGFDTFCDTDRPAGDAFDNELRHQVDRSSHFLVILTPEILERGDATISELASAIETAQRSRKVIIPILAGGLTLEAGVRFLSVNHLPLQDHYLYTIHDPSDDSTAMDMPALIGHLKRQLLSERLPSHLS